MTKTKERQPGAENTDWGKRNGRTQPAWIENLVFLVGLPHSHQRLSRDMTKPIKWLCAQRRLRSAWASESSLCAQWVAKDPSFLHADSEDSDRTGWMPRLIWVFAGRTATLLLFSLRGSFQSCHKVPKELSCKWQLCHYSSCMCMVKMGNDSLLFIELWH